MFGQRALLKSQHLNLLLHLRNAGALLAGFGLGCPQHFFKCWQLRVLLFALRGEQFGFFFGLKCLRAQRFGFKRCFALALRPLRCLLFELRQPLLYPQSAVHHKAYLGLEPTHVAAGLIQFALRLVDVVACSVVRLADGLQIRFNVAQIGHPGLQVVDCFVSAFLDFALVALRVGAL